jgi:hypothetical protein
MGKIEGSSAYDEMRYSDEIFFRKFSKDIDPNELKWHYDENDRFVASIGATDWKIQLDNKLPQEIDGFIEIKNYVKHRLIKGTKDLTMIVIEKR